MKLTRNTILSFFFLFFFYLVKSKKKNLKFNKPHLDQYHLLRLIDG